MAKRSPPKTVFRSKPWLRALSASSVVLFGSLAVFLAKTEGGSMWAIIGALLFVLAACGFAQTWTSSVELLEDALVVSTGFRWRRYDRRELESVTWEGGSGVALRRTSGSWLKLPELGHNSQSLYNGIRAWLRRTGSTADRLPEDEVPIPNVAIEEESR
jgi:hypothetical protein